MKKSDKTTGKAKKFQRRLPAPVFILAAGLLVFSAGAMAYELKEMTPEASEILFRQKSREEVLGQFKASGLAGESADGYLVARGEPKSTRKMVEEENADRRKLYGVIAQQNRLGASGIGAVESAAAAKNRDRAQKGTYVQLATGRWVQK